MKKRILSMMLVVAMMATMLAGCGGSSEEAGESESSENSITVLVESGGPAEASAIATAEAFEEQTGCKVIVDAVPYAGLYEKVSTEIKAKQAVHDVATLDVVWLAALKEAIEPLNDIDTSDFLPTLEESGTIDGDLLGYPMWVNAKILIYRKDLIPEDKVPATWEEYQALSAELTTGDMKGTTVYGSGTDALCSYFDFVCQAGAKGLVFDENGNVNITEQPYVDALNFMVENANADYTPGDALATESTETVELFNNEKIAMMLNWSHQYPVAVEALGLDKVGCAPMIGGSAGVGATTGPWYQCVMKNSENKDMAMEYVKFMYEHNEDYMNYTLKIAGRTSVYEKFGTVEGNEHTSAVLETLSSEQTQARPMIETWPQIEEVMVGVVESCIGGADINETLEAAKAQIETIVE